MIEFHNYVGGPIRQLLKHPVVSQWTFERSEDEWLPEIVYYVFPRNGLEIQCDDTGTVLTIFLFAKKYGGFNDQLTPISLHDSRAGVLERYGKPVQSGAPQDIPFLGKIGHWDRFEDGSKSTHFAFDVNSGRIETVTLMDSARVPK